MDLYRLGRKSDHETIIRVWKVHLQEVRLQLHAGHHHSSLAEVGMRLATARASNKASALTKNDPVVVERHYAIWVDSNLLRERKRLLSAQSAKT